MRHKLLKMLPRCGGLSCKACGVKNNTAWERELQAASKVVNYMTGKEVRAKMIRTTGSGETAKRPVNKPRKRVGHTVRTIAVPSTSRVCVGSEGLLMLWKVAGRERNRRV